jgi:hypothetical protein
MEVYTLLRENLDPLLMFCQTVEVFETLAI